MKKLVLALLIILASYAPALAEEMKIGFIDLQLALDESDAGKKARSDLEDSIKKTEAKINEKIAAREKLDAEIKKQEGVMSSEARRQKLDELEKLDKEVERMKDDAEAEMQKKQRDMAGSILSELKTIIDKVADEGGYTIILPAEAIIYAKKSIDITTEVINRYNESKTKGNGKEEGKKSGEKKQ
jgi:outer membrane protein